MNFVGGGRSNAEQREDTPRSSRLRSISCPLLGTEPLGSDRPFVGDITHLWNAETIPRHEPADLAAVRRHSVAFSKNSKATALIADVDRPEMNLAVEGISSSIVENALRRTLLVATVATCVGCDRELASLVVWRTLKIHMRLAGSGVDFHCIDAARRATGADPPSKETETGLVVAL